MTAPEKYPDSKDQQVPIPLDRAMREGQALSPAFPKAQCYRSRLRSPSQPCSPNSQAEEIQRGYARGLYLSGTLIDLYPGSDHVSAQSLSDSLKYASTLPNQKASPSANPKKKRKTRGETVPHMQPTSQAKSKARSSAKTSSPSPPKTSTYTLTHKRKRKETKSKYNKTKNQLPPTTASNAGLNLAEKNSLDSTRDSTNSNISASTPSIPTHANVDRTRVRENATMPGVGGSTEVSKLPKIVSPTRRVLKR
eukprot:1334561-Amorphochlora_amoeboformis.AAC.1